MFLTPDQLAEMTDCTRSDGQIRWLEARGYPYEVGQKGRVKVLAEVVRLRMGGVSSEVPERQPMLRLPA